HLVGDTSVTLSRASLTTKQLIIGYTYDRPVQGHDDTGYDQICARTVTSREGDTFKKAGAIDGLPGTIKAGVVHGSTVVYFPVVQLQSGSSARHLRLLLQPCSPSGTGQGTGVDVAFDFTVPVQ